MDFALRLVLHELDPELQLEVTGTQDAAAYPADKGQGIRCQRALP